MFEHNRRKMQHARMNAPAAIIRRVEARRAAITAGPEPERPIQTPGMPWYTITIACPGHAVVITSDVPRNSSRRRARSETWDVALDDGPAQRMGSAAIGRLVAAQIVPRMPLSALAGIQPAYTERDEADAAAAWPG